MADDLETKTVAQLTTLYNEVPGTKPVKKFSTKPEAIRRYRQALSAWEKANPPSAKPGKPSPKRRAPHAKTSVSQRCKQLIREGLTNAEVWAIVKAEFGLDDKKKYYPAWNRSWLVRHGENV